MPVFFLFKAESSILNNLELSSGVCTNEPTWDKKSNSISCTMFIFGGSLATSKLLNTAHNIILYSEINPLLK